MANTYSQITMQVVFAVKAREALIEDTFNDRLHAYISGIVANQGQKLLAINSARDHIHILLGLDPDNRLSDLVREVKSESSRFVNENRLSRYRFYWQNGFGAFSYSRSQRPMIINYIMQQSEHHRRISFREEYIELLKAFEIEYDDRYLFDFFN